MGEPFILFNRVGEEVVFHSPKVALEMIQDGLLFESPPEPDGDAVLDLDLGGIPITDIVSGQAAEALTSAGYSTVASVWGLGDEDLLAISGVGPATVRAIRGFSKAD